MTFSLGTGSVPRCLLNLRRDSAGGPVIGTSAQVSLRDGAAVFATFVFDTPGSVTPGQVYYFQPAVQSGDLWGAAGAEYNYQGGSAFNAGLAVPGSDYWFREGLVVPEPSASVLLLAGAGIWVWIGTKRAQ